MRPPTFTLQDIRYADDPEMFSRADDLFRSGKVGKIREDRRGYSAQVKGTKTYEVSVSYKRIDVGYCSCYMGQSNVLCKHMLALALAVLDKVGSLDTAQPPKDLDDVKELVSDGFRKIKAYDGPSRTWFTYQRSLATGAGIIMDAIESLSPSEKNANYLWKLVLRISKKLATGGVDDSDGVVGTCVYSILEKLKEFAKESPEIKMVIVQFCKDDTGFGFEDDLRAGL